MKPLPGLFDMVGAPGICILLAIVCVIVFLLPNNEE